MSQTRLLGECTWPIRSSPMVARIAVAWSFMLISSHITYALQDLSLHSVGILKVDFGAMVVAINQR